MKKHTLALSIATALLSSASFAQEKDIWMGGFAEYYYADKDKFEFTPQDRIDWGWGRFNESCET
jgi:OOP family OmpA-OmpF porin